MLAIFVHYVLTLSSATLKVATTIFSNMVLVMNLLIHTVIYPCIFTFLSFPLHHWSTAMQHTDVISHMTHTSLHDHLPSLDPLPIVPLDRLCIMDKQMTYIPDHCTLSIARQVPCHFSYFDSLLFHPVSCNSSNQSPYCRLTNHKSLHHVVSESGDLLLFHCKWALGSFNHLYFLYRLGTFCPTKSN